MATGNTTTEHGFSGITTAHEKICASFLGPKGENHKALSDNFTVIANKILEARQEFAVDDPPFINEEIMTSKAFTDQVEKTKKYLDALGDLLKERCIPFFSPRYNGHMVSDASIPSYLGYLIGMLWNQNNVTPEASPITSYIEYAVGQQICEMLGYGSTTRDPHQPSVPTGWGHITCDGTVANIEAFWAARNVKFYPLSLKLAITDPDNALSFVADKLQTVLCTGEIKQFTECSDWELLNLTVDEVLNLSTRLTEVHGISPTSIKRAVEPYLIAKKGSQWLEKQGSQWLEKEIPIKTPQAYISASNHYSWPKTASLTAVGIENLVSIPVDTNFRMDTTILREKLEENLENKRAVFSVIAVMGTTEHGAVDPVLDILQIRQEFQKLGLSFYVHTDAAWGGYFTSMLRSLRKTPKHEFEEFVRQRPLSEYTTKQLSAISSADSCTIDPHKAGYSPYPAGCLCYRDERLRFMVTMSAAYLNADEDFDTMGSYGVEGSKPGAAPTAVWLTHHAIGLDHTGYGTLLGEAMFTSAKLYANWATMTYGNKKLIVKPLVLLPSEQRDLSESEVEAEIQYFKSNIVDKSNSEIINDERAMKRLKELGPDLIIIVFACNFYINGQANKDITEANFLNRRMFKRFSVTSHKDRPRDRKLIIGSTKLDRGLYNEALKGYKQRLGLKGDGDLTVLTLVPMSPFPISHDMIKEFVDTFKTAAMDEAQDCCNRITSTGVHHSFVMQGIKRLFLSYISVFSIGSYRQQMIITGTLSNEAMTTYVDAVKNHRGPHAPPQFFLTTEPAPLSEILSKGFCKVSIYGLPIDFGTEKPTFTPNADLTGIQVIINRSIAPGSLDDSWPESMPFYLYGTKEEQHIDHVLCYAPNTRLASAQVTLIPERSSLDILPCDGDLLTPLIAITDIREIAMQPFNARHKPDSFFQAERKLPVTIYRDPKNPETSGPKLSNGFSNQVVIAKGTITLSSDIFIDYTLVNQERGPAISASYTSENADMQTLQRLIGGIYNGGKPYDMTPIDIAAIWKGWVLTHPAEEYERKLADREGWKDEVDRALEKQGLPPIPRSEKGLRKSTKM